MLSEITLKIIAHDRPGVLDRIAGLIRRKGWNVSSLNAGDMGNGFSQINISLKGRNVDVQALEDYLSELDGIHRWEECGTAGHILRELVMVRVPKELHPIPELEGARIVEERDRFVFAEYTGSPAEVDHLLQKLRERGLHSVRTGSLVMDLEGEE